MEGGVFYSMQSYKINHQIQEKVPLVASFFKMVSIKGQDKCRNLK